MASFTAINTPVPQKNPGHVVTMEATIAAVDAASCGNWHIALMLIGPNNQLIKEHLLFGQALTETPRTFTRSYTLPANAAVGSYQCKASVRGTDWKWHTVTQTPALFEVVARMVLYGTHSPRLTLLKPAGSGDPLSGTGFLPDDGRAYTLVEGDEFNGSALDTAKWWRRYRDNNGTLAYFNDELQRYTDNHIVADGALKLTACVKPGTEGHAPANGNTYPFYDSSMIRSRTTFKHGYVEARMKLPNGLGVWPAFWILADGNRPCEIDIMEFVINGANEFADMIHGGNVHSILDSGIRWRDDKYNPQYSYWRAWGMSQPTYFVDDWHVFGLLWEADQIIYYINGEPVVQRKITWTNGGVDGGLASVILNLAMGGSWPTNGWTTPVATDDQVLAVDYVRVFQRSDSIITGISQV